MSWQDFCQLCVHVGRAESLFVCGLAPRAKEEMKDWDVESAIATYNVDGWGSGYFTLNDEGNVVAKPLQENGGRLNLLEVVNEARPGGLGFPPVIRFPH